MEMLQMGLYEVWQEIIIYSYHVDTRALCIAAGSYGASKWCSFACHLENQEEKQTRCNFSTLFFLIAQIVTQHFCIILKAPVGNQRTVVSIDQIGVEMWEQVRRQEEKKNDQYTSEDGLWEVEMISLKEQNI